VDTGDLPFAHFQDLTARGNVRDGAGNELYGCHRPSQGYLNLRIDPSSPAAAGKVFYWGAKSKFDFHYAVDGWQLATGVRNAPPLPGTPIRTPLDGAIQTPTGQGILLEKSEERAAADSYEKGRVALSHLSNDGHEAFEANGYSIQEQAAQYAPQGNSGNPYQTLPGHGFTY
jgi:hypothetical protein